MNRSPVHRAAVGMHADRVNLRGIDMRGFFRSEYSGKALPEVLAGGSGSWHMVSWFRVKGRHKTDLFFTWQRRGPDGRMASVWVLACGRTQMETCRLVLILVSFEGPFGPT